MARWGRMALRILIIDDDRATLRVLGEPLGAAGHDVALCERGTAGMALLMRTKFDLVICDVMMPIVGGVQVMRWLRDRAPNIPIIAISASETTAWIDECCRAGAAFCLPKPVDPRELIQRVALLEQSILCLSFGVVEGNLAHGVVVRQQLHKRGHTSCCWDSTQEYLDQPPTGAQAAVMLVDMSLPGVAEIIVSARLAGRVIVGIVDELTEKRQEEWLQAGVSFFSRRPVDPDMLATQASFQRVQPSNDSARMLVGEMK